MKKLIFVLLLNAYLFSCTGQGCISRFSDCYGKSCIANGGSCYGESCIANGGSKNSLPQSIIDQYSEVIFTSAQQLANLEKQLAATNDSQYLDKIKINLQILQEQPQTDPNSFNTNFTKTLNTIKTLIPNPVPENLRRFSDIVSNSIQPRGLQEQILALSNLQRELIRAK